MLLVFLAISTAYLTSYVAYRHRLLVHRLHRHLALLGHQGARAVAGRGSVRRLLIGGLPCHVVVPGKGGSRARPPHPPPNPIQAQTDRRYVSQPCRAQYNTGSRATNAYDKQKENPKGIPPAYTQETSRHTRESVVCGRVRPYCCYVLDTYCTRAGENAVWKP